MLNLEEEIFDHSLGQSEAMVAQQPQNDEVTVPTVHFIELATRDDVGMGQVQQALRVNGGYIGAAGSGDFAGEAAEAHVTALLEIAHRRGDGRLKRKIKDGLGIRFWIDKGGALRSGPGQVVPRCGDISEDVRARRGGNLGLLNATG